MKSPKLAHENCTFEEIDSLRGVEAGIYEGIGSALRHLDSSCDFLIAIKLDLHKARAHGGDVLLRHRLIDTPLLTLERMNDCHFGKEGRRADHA